MEINFTELEQRVLEDERERLLKGEAPTLYRSVTNAIRTSDDAEGLTFVASEETEDRSGDVIKASGWDLKNFRRNPVMQWAHDYRRPPIGRWTKVWTEGNQLLARGVFDRNDDFATLIEAKYRGKFLNAVSVGFRALEFEPLPQKDSDDGMFFPPLLFKRSELLEISAVPLPAHPAALRKGLDLLEAAPKYFLMPGVEQGSMVATEEQASASPDEQFAIPVWPDHLGTHCAECGAEPNFAETPRGIVAEAHRILGNLLADEPDSKANVDDDEGEAKIADSMHDDEQDEPEPVDDLVDLIAALRAPEETED